MENGIAFADLADSREFVEFVGIVRELSGLLVVLVDASGGQSKKLFPDDAFNPLCRLIQSRPAGLQACQDTDRMNCADAARQKQGLQYHCHAGLIDMAVPIYIERRHIATINSGQVLPEPPSEQGFQQLLLRLRSLEIPEVQLRSVYFHTPYLTATRLTMILRLCTFFAEYCCVMGRRLKEAESRGEQQAIARALRYLQQHYRTVDGLAETAAAVHLSPAYFSTRFKQTTGVTHTHYVNRLRIAEAQSLLRDTDRAITDIALAVGFTNYTHFYRVFQQQAGCSPSEYRTRNDESPAPTTQPFTDERCSSEEGSRLMASTR